MMPMHQESVIALIIREAITVQNTIIITITAMVVTTIITTIITDTNK